MTPDMRRLALAVAKVRWHDPTVADEEWTDEALANFECEAIVRAVLTELREMSEDTRIVALNTGLPQVGEPPLYEKMWLGVLDHILGEPATA